jgi:hypothetical protein
MTVRLTRLLQPELDREKRSLLSPMNGKDYAKGWLWRHCGMIFATKNPQIHRKENAAVASSRRQSDYN